MKVVTGKALSNALRHAVDRAKSRLWIASPYIGSWPNNVRRLLGTTWQSEVADARLLTDIEARGFRESTLAQFFRRGEVRSLRGLHAKLFVADDWALLGSANLTGMAFSRRYEAGIILTGAAAREAAALFDTWWELPNTNKVREDQLPTPKAQGRPDPDEPGNGPLPFLNGLPPDVADAVPLPGKEFGDYTPFIERFEALAAEYKRVQRIWPRSPIAFEVDSFLNYLYHEHPDRPSTAFAKRKPRVLTPARQRAEIARYARAFKVWMEDADADTKWRDSAAQNVRVLLLKNRKRGLSRNQVRELLLELNSMQAYQINLHAVLNPRNNSLRTVQKALRHLIDEDVPVQRRMADVTQAVAFLGKAAVQELVGFYYNGRCPLRNKNTNCGLRFLGYDVRVN